MSSRRQVAANRRNARLSTGPRTDPGKAVASRNAVKHGLLSSRPLIPGETEEEFITFAEAMIEQLQPQNALECLLAERIIAAGWRLRRVLPMEAGLLTRNQASRDDSASMGSAFSHDALYTNSISKLQRYETSLERGWMRNLKEFSQLQDRRTQVEINNEKLRNEANFPPAEGTEDINPVSSVPSRPRA